ncbi:MAG: helix-turn-helix domain-containing protein [Treponema sp.]|jgi:excisionase family DNA binding protein|nr:helix-turn-helix domain-containing protein [Treponema sp.]
MSGIISPELLTRKEAAVYLRICRSTLDTLVIPRIKIRRRVLFRRSDLNQWLDQNMQIKGGKK